MTLTLCSASAVSFLFPNPHHGCTPQLFLQAWGCGTGPEGPLSTSAVRLWVTQVRFETQMTMAEVTCPPGRLRGALGSVRDMLLAVSRRKLALAPHVPTWD